MRRHSAIILAIVAAGFVLAFIDIAARKSAALLETSRTTARSIGRQLAGLRARDAAARERKATLQEEMSSLSNGRQEKGGSGGQKKGNDDNMRFDRMLSENPELLAAWNAREKIRLQKYYGTLIRQLGLSGSQADSFLALLVEDESRSRDLYDLAETEGLSASDVQSLRKAQTNDLETEERELLGINGFQQAQDFGRVQAAADALTWLAGGLAFTAPLSTAQGDKLIQAFEKGSVQFQSGATLNLASVDWPFVMAQAQSILSPDQYAEFAGVTAPLFRSRAEFGALGAALNPGTATKGPP
jgi:hypothetical protein